MPKAFGYVRVSTDEQFNRATSIASQIAQIIYYAGRPGFEFDLGRVVQLDVDGHRIESRENILLEPISAYKTPFTARPMGQRIFVECEPGDCMIAAKLDRAFRNAVDAHNTLERFKNRKVAIVLLDIGMDLSTATGELLFGMLAAVAQMESRRRSERMHEANRARKQQGRLSPARTPALMKWVGVGKGRRPEFCWEEYEIAVRAVQMWIDGISVDKICGIFRKEGVHIPKLRPHEYNQYGSEYNASRMRSIINGLLFLREIAEKTGVPETDPTAILRWMNEYGSNYRACDRVFPKQHLRQGKPKPPESGR